MRLRLLRRRHADCDCETWERYIALFHGGKRFRQLIPKLLPRHDVEPPAVYKQRCDAANYLDYCSPIGNYFSSMLFSSPPVIRSEPETVDAFYAAFKEDCDGNGTDLEAFVEARFIEALVTRCTYWRVELPAPPSAEVAATLSRKDYDEAGFRRPRLVALNADQIINWRMASDGGYLWVVEYDRREELFEWADEQLTVTETWTHWTDAAATRWSTTYPKNQAPSDDVEVAQVEPPPHFGRIPIVRLELPETLWLMNFLADPALEHFRKSCGLSWSIDRSCYAMPYFFLKNPKQPPIQGSGYYGILGAEDRVEWPAPSNVPYDVLERRIAALKDEIHRVAVQMSRGVDNNAAAVGRSGESKQADDSATEIVLEAYGRPVKDAYEETFQIIAFARGEDIEWSVEGMDAYDVADAAAVIENALAAQPLEIPSATYQVEIKTRAALAQMRDAKEEVKQKVRQEIQRATTAESVMPMGTPRLGDEEQPPNEQRRAGPTQRSDKAGVPEPGKQPEPG
jgi:hypothetical protein